MTDDIWWLNLYVILSRATALSKLVLLGLDHRVKQLLEKGPPEYIRTELAKLQAKTARTEAEAMTLAQQWGWHIPQE